MKSFEYVRLAVAALHWSAATAFAALLFLPAIPALARPTGEGETQITRCIHRVAADRPWLEKTLWGLRDQEAGWIGAEVRNTNGSHDLGPLQINSGWVPRVASLLDRSEADVRYWLRYDPCFNADAARWIFLSALNATGAYWKAVGIYHSPTHWRQHRYAQSVAHHMRLRFGRDVFSGYAPVRPVVPDGEGPSDAGRAAMRKVRIYGFGILRGSPS
jgi:hypothetical protein